MQFRNTGELNDTLLGAIQAHVMQERYRKEYSDIPGQYLDRMLKGIVAADVAPVAVEDREVEAHNTLWNESDPSELIGLKFFPRVEATQVNHIFQRLNSFGPDGFDGFMNETSLPPATQPGLSNHTSIVKLMGERSIVYILAALTRTVNVMGMQGAANWAPALTRLQLLRRMGRAMYFSDTRTDLNGAAGMKFTGLLQAIQEGTIGSPIDSGESQGAVYDMLGTSPTFDNLRQRILSSWELFGQCNVLIMDGRTRSRLEQQLDGSHQLWLPANTRPIVWGQKVVGMTTNGQDVYFLTDRMMAPMYSWPRYTTSRPAGFPSGTPTIVATAGSDSGSPASRWTASSFGGAGNVAYVATEVVNGIETIGTRYPTGSGVIAVAAGQMVTITVTPSNPAAESIKLYRLLTGITGAGTAATDAWLIAETPGSGDGSPITFIDKNLQRPGTSMIFGLRLASRAFDAYLNGGSYEAVKRASPDLMGVEEESIQNTVSCVNLGPRLMVLDLAKLGAVAHHKLMCGALTIQHRNPAQAFVIRNIYNGQ